MYRKPVPNVPSPLLSDGDFYALKEGGIGISLSLGNGESVSGKQDGTCIRSYVLVAGREGWQIYVIK
jgi:hypothetical protein